MGALLRTARNLGVAPVDVDLLSPYPLNECLLRLHAAISPFGSLLFAGPVVGEITGTRLRARKRIFRNGGFQAHLVANLIDSSGQTFIKCRFTIRWWDFCFFLTWMAVAFAIWVESPPEASTTILSFIGLGGFGGLSFMLYLARKERRFLIKFIGDAVGAREIQKSAAT